MAACHGHAGMQVTAWCIVRNDSNNGHHFTQFHTSDVPAQMMDAMKQCHMQRHRAWRQAANDGQHSTCSSIWCIIQNGTIDATNFHNFTFDPCCTEPACQSLTVSIFRLSPLLVILFSSISNTYASLWSTCVGGTTCVLMGE